MATIEIKCIKRGSNGKTIFSKEYSYKKSYREVKPFIKKIINQKLNQGFVYSEYSSPNLPKKLNRDEIYKRAIISLAYEWGFQLKKGNTEYWISYYEVGIRQERLEEERHQRERDNFYEENFLGTYEYTDFMEDPHDTYI